MKKYFLLSAISILTLGAVTSCDDRNNDVVQQDNDTYGVAYDIAPTFTKKSTNLYQYTDSFNSALLESDVVLIYMQTGLTTNNSPIWKLLPYTFYVNNTANDEVDYSFDFSKYDISISVNSTSTLNLDTNTTYYTNKRFRVVIVPAKTGKNANIDYNDYNSIIKLYGIDESKIKVKP